MSCAGPWGRILVQILCESVKASLSAGGAGATGREVWLGARVAVTPASQGLEVVYPELLPLLPAKILVED